MSTRVKYTWLKELRMKAGLSQQQMAEYLGVSQPAVSYWETTDRVPKKYVVTISELFDVPISDIPKGHGKNYEQ